MSVSPSFWSLGSVGLGTYNLSRGRRPPSDGEGSETRIHEEPQGYNEGIVGGGDR